MLGAGAAVAGMAVAISGGDAGQIIDDYHTGVAGQVGLTLLCGFYAPNVAVWSASYLVGPGFAVGADTTISAAEVSVGPLPAVPLLAGLPSTPATGWAPLLLGLPLAAALVAGWLLARRSLRDDPDRGWVPLLGAAALAGPVAGLLLGLVSVAASGPLGGGAAGRGRWPHAARWRSSRCVIGVASAQPAWRRACDRSSAPRGARADSRVGHLRPVTRPTWKRKRPGSANSGPGSVVRVPV